MKCIICEKETNIIIGFGDTNITLASCEEHMDAVKTRLKTMYMDADDQGMSHEEYAFEIIWKEYSLKKKKKAAQQAFKKATKIKSFDTLFKAVRAYNAWIERNTINKALLSSWLNGERWNDDFSIDEYAKKTPNNNEKKLTSGEVQRLDDALFGDD